MKTNVSNYVRLLRDNYNGSPWYGDALLQKLETLTAEEAFAVPAPGLHSVAQQVAHLLAWRRLLAERLKGNNDFQIQVNSARDWAPTELLEKKGWETLLAELDANQTELLHLLESETDDLLDRPLPDGKHAFRLLLDGIVQHDVYHTGQIGMTLTMQRQLEKVKI